MNNLSLNGNWVDLVIILIVVFFLVEGFRHGFWVVLANFLAFLISLLVSLRYYQFTADLLRVNFTLSHSVSNALGFLATAVLIELFLGYVFGHFIVRIPSKYWKGWGYKLLAFLPATGEALVLISFLLLLILGLPISPRLKTETSNSKLGNLIVQQVAGLESRTREIFGGVVEDSLTHLTIKPGSRERVLLTTEAQELKMDEPAEREMLELINEERRKAGRKELVWDETLVPVARAHAADMWQNQYFGHISLDDKDIGDRLDEAGVDYLVAGENLALAPTVSTAHTGLMNSEGHRENILEEDFQKAVVGVIDGGIPGKMFVQIFIQ